MKSTETTTNENLSKAASNQVFGNNGVSLFAPGNRSSVQAKLTINEPNDIYEQEADKVANEVMLMQSPAIQTKPLQISSIQRMCSHCEEEQKNMQRKESGHGDLTADNETESYVGNLNGGGQALPGDVRSFFESRIGYDFSNVKVHTDSVAAKSAQSINALAYTTGNNIVFNEGQYSPNTDSGKRLLGHELTHVVQQGSLDNRISRFLVPDETDTAMNTEAPNELNYTPTDENTVSSEDLNYTPASDAGVSTTCPTQTVSMSGAECGTRYGAVGRYCYSGAAGWWFKERVVNGPGAHCQGGSITQTSTPFQSRNGCVGDQIFDFNGPPGNVAPCSDTTFQTVFTGPTQATVEQCQYQNTQVIDVTRTAGSNPPSGKVTTTSGGVSTDCDWS
jgi:hypothetical protein